MRNFSKSRLFKIAHAKRRDGLTMSMALKLAWAEVKADWSDDVVHGDAYVIEFFKKSTGELTTRRAYTIAAGRGGAILFRSMDDNMEWRAFRPELLVSVKKDDLTNAEINMAHNFFEGQA